MAFGEYTIFVIVFFLPLEVIVDLCLRAMPRSTYSAAFVKRSFVPREPAIDVEAKRTAMLLPLAVHTVGGGLVSASS